MGVGFHNSQDSFVWQIFWSEQIFWFESVQIKFKQKVKNR